MPHGARRREAARPKTQGAQPAPETGAGRAGGAEGRPGLEGGERQQCAEPAGQVPELPPRPPGDRMLAADSAGEVGVQFAFQKEARRGWELATGALATPASASPRLRVEWEAGRGEALEASWESPCPAPFPPSTAAVWAQTHL